MRISRVSGTTFRTVFRFHRDTSDLVREMCSDPEGIEQEGSAYYLSDDALSGFVIRSDGELCYLFSVVKGRGATLVDIAVGSGADHLDCFDGYLPSLYEGHGFRETRREANWTPGAPDVVYMSRRAPTD